MVGVNMSEIIRNSENFKKAVAEGRVGGASKRDDVKKKISNSLKEYYKDVCKEFSENIILKMRKSRALKSGIPVIQYDLNNKYISLNYLKYLLYFFVYQLLKEHTF